MRTTLIYDRAAGTVTLPLADFLELLADRDGTPAEPVATLFDSLHDADDATWAAHFAERFGKQP